MGLGFAVVRRGVPHGQRGLNMHRWVQISWSTAKAFKHSVNKALSSSPLAATAVLSACISIPLVSPIL